MLSFQLLAGRLIRSVMTTFALVADTSKRNLRMGRVYFRIAENLGVKGGTVAGGGLFIDPDKTRHKNPFCFRSSTTAQSSGPVLKYQLRKYWRKIGVTIN